MHFRRELRETTGSEAQTEYLYTLFANHPVLSRISTLTSADDVLGLASGMLVGHPRFEQILVTRALLRALGIATANSTYQRLMITMQLDQYLATKVGAFRELMAEVRRRARLPGTAARADLARLLQQAGQTQARLVVTSDDQVTLEGSVRFTLNLSGGNAEKMHTWLRGGQRGALRLDATNGMVGLTLGHPELDAWFSLAPQNDQSGVLELRPQPFHFPLRLKVEVPGHPAQYVQSDMEHDPAEDTWTLHLGDPDTAHFHLRISHTGHTAHFHVARPTALLPQTLRPVLRGIKALMSPEMTGTDTQRGLTFLTEERVWRDTPEVNEFRNWVWTTCETHLMYLDIARHAEEHGQDLNAMVLPHDLDDVDLAVLATVASAVRGVPRPLDASGLFPTRSDVEALTSTMDQGKALIFYATLDFGGFLIRSQQQLVRPTVTVGEPNEDGQYPVAVSGEGTSTIIEYLSPQPLLMEDDL